MEEERRLTYEALLMEADGRWATIREIEEVVGRFDLDEVLFGLVHLRELDATMFDDGETCFKLTELGSRFASGMILG
jgi:hypothetical protein